MRAFADIVNSFEDFVAYGGADEEQIIQAESALHLEFNADYKAFLKQYGAACSNGHEIMGICNSKRLDVVENTLREKQKNPNIQDNMYLIENMGIDDVLIWQTREGMIYQTSGNSVPKKLSNNLCEYINF